MILRLALAAAALLAAIPARAAGLREELLALQRLDARIQTIGWQLARSNARYCRDATPGIGLQLFDAAGFDNPAAVRATLGLDGDLAIAAVAHGGPADRAGLTAGLPLGAIAARPVADLPAARAGDYRRVAALHDAVEAQLAIAGNVEFTDAAGRRYQVGGEPACPSRFEMLTRGSRASADGKRVLIGRKLVEELTDDGLLAAALAHELAHNLLGHRGRLDLEGRSWAKVKATEREADRMMPWLLANAGHDPAAAVRFFEVWGPKHDLGLFATPDHDGWKERARRIRAELVAVAAARRPDGTADWTTAFASGLQN